MTRDEFCTALQQLYGYEPKKWDGLTLEEIAQAITLDQLDAVYKHLGVAA